DGAPGPRTARDGRLFALLLLRLAELIVAALTGAHHLLHFPLDLFGQPLTGGVGERLRVVLEILGVLHEFVPLVPDDRQGARVRVGAALRKATREARRADCACLRVWLC